MKYVKTIGATFGVAASLVLAGCGDNTSLGTQSNEEQVSISQALDYTITGIEPGAGMMQLTEMALNEYENLKGWKVSESSTAGMLTMLDKAIQSEEPIIVTGWNPHWKFATYDLKYLEDPKGTFGEVENINTIVRKDLKEEHPTAYEMLDRFYWEPEDMEQVMLDAQTVTFEEAAKKWAEQNQEKVNEWMEGLQSVNGEKFELVSTPWETEEASSHVVKFVLEQLGYDVTITPVDPIIMFQAIANGEGDASVAPWLPVTHGSFYEQYKGDIIDLGENLVGAKVGLVVPSYMDIDSIEDLEPKE
ncbi:glycine betaine ABC transporter substrate-binding protein [Ureibacillus sp. FSL K6-2830]|uniref:glycine betaine ABC transporter substrate-binding protein n=1 Tax=Ureibacillus sp. FSL K6-2830 TaxID=2954610 RepID=UPI0030FCC8B5